MGRILTPQNFRLFENFRNIYEKLIPTKHHFSGPGFFPGLKNTTKHAIFLSGIFRCAFDVVECQKTQLKLSFSVFTFLIETNC